MAKKTRKPRKTKAKAQPNPQQSNAAKLQSRRTFMQYGIGAVALVIGGGYWGVTSLQASIGETDLTQLGQGIPTIVQIHDPTCPICNKLQREARAALKDMEGAQPDYLVANIKTLEGSAFAADHGVPHVTLLLFDGKGALRQTLSGPQQRDDLTPIFEDLMARYGPRS